MEMRICCAVLAVALTAVSAVAGDGKVHKAQPHEQDQYLVSFEPGVVDATALAEELARTHGLKLRYTYARFFKGMSFRGSAEAAEAVALDARVKRVEENGLGKTQQVAPVNPPGWALDRVDQASLPLSTTFHTGNSSLGAMIYVADTGVTPIASEFGTRVRTIWSWEVSTADAVAGVGHGTPVSSVAAGATVGVAYDAQIVNVKVCDGAGTCPSDRVIAGIEAINADFLTQNPRYPHLDKAAAVNMSFAIAPAAPNVEEAIAASIRLGISYVVAAGNSSPRDTAWLRHDAKFYTPARMGKPLTAENPYAEHTLTVGATTLPSPWNRDYASLISNYGSVIDIWAPGEQVRVMGKNGTIAYVDGTSFATPYATGRTAQKSLAYTRTNAASATTADTVEWYVTTLSTANIVYEQDTQSTVLRGGATNRFLRVY